MRLELRTARWSFVPIESSTGMRPSGLRARHRRRASKASDSRPPSTYISAGFARTFPQFPRLGIHNLYRGVDAVFYGNGDRLEYDLHLSPRVPVEQIRIAFEGTRRVLIDGRGDLTIATPSGVLQQLRPRAFQGTREIPARYVLLAGNEVGIRLGKHNRRLPLTIDPVLAWVKTFGASGGSMATAVATDTQGNVYVTGQTSAVDFPSTSNSFEPNSNTPLRLLSNADGAILYAATSDGIFLSGDSGATWRRTSPLPLPATANSPQSVTVNVIARPARSGTS